MFVYKHHTWSATGSFCQAAVDGCHVQHVTCIQKIQRDANVALALGRKSKSAARDDPASLQAPNSRLECSHGEFESRALGLTCASSVAQRQSLVTSLLAFTAQRSFSLNQIFHPTPGFASMLLCPKLVEGREIYVPVQLILTPRLEKYPLLWQFIAQFRIL